MPGAGGGGLGCILQVPTTCGEAGLQIILLQCAECRMGQGSPEQGQLARPEAGDFGGCPGGVACCQMERPRVPAFGRTGQGIGDSQMCPGGWRTVRLEAWWGDRAGPARAAPCQPHWGPGPRPSSGRSSLSLNERDREACLRPVLSEHW